MTKILFFDYREVETAKGFTRRLQQPKKHGANPLFIADAPWENGNMQLYGSVVKPPDKPFQLWYSAIHPPFVIYMAYAESDDGLAWRKPLFDVHEYEGRKTNIVFDREPHGQAIIYDAADPDPARRYKMLCGATPSHAICAFTSPDGIAWNDVHRFPVITTGPDSPMALYRDPEGRFVAHHRVQGLGRRICRSTSWDFRHWSSDTCLVMEPDAGDPVQTQFYGMGATAYGSYHIGTLWMYHTEVDDTGPGKMRGYQETELTYARSGTAWHRAAQGEVFIPHGTPGDWDQGNLQCASAPVFLEDEIRYYYAGTDMFHKTHWELDPQTAGLGLATLRPDGFVAMEAGADTAEMLTGGVRVPSMDLRVNADIADDGVITAELLDRNNAPLPGFSGDDAATFTGDSLDHESGWTGRPVPEDNRLRIRLTARNARLYSIFFVEKGETPLYHQFEAASP